MGRDMAASQHSLKRKLFSPRQFCFSQQTIKSTSPLICALGLLAWRTSLFSLRSKISFLKNKQQKKNPALGKLFSSVKTDIKKELIFTYCNIRCTRDHNTLKGLKSDATLVMDGVTLMDALFGVYVNIGRK